MTQWSGEYLTFGQKKRLHYLGWYLFEVPPVHANWWTPEDWIHWIDTNGQWLPNQGKQPYFMPDWLRKLGVTLEDESYYDAGSLLT